jgi:hypothetical protein
MLQKEAQANQAKGDVEGVDLWGRLTDFSTVVGDVAMWAVIARSSKKERRTIFAYLISLRHQITRKSFGKLPLAEDGH